MDNSILEILQNSDNLDASDIIKKVAETIGPDDISELRARAEIPPVIQELMSYKLVQDAFMKRVVTELCAGFPLSREFSDIPLDLQLLAFLKDEHFFSIVVPVEYETASAEEILKRIRDGLFLIAKNNYPDMTLFSSESGVSRNIPFPRQMVNEINMTLDTLNKTEYLDDFIYSLVQGGLEF